MIEKTVREGNAVHEPECTGQKVVPARMAKMNGVKVQSHRETRWEMRMEDWRLLFMIERTSSSLILRHKSA